MAWEYDGYSPLDFDRIVAEIELAVLYRIDGDEVWIPKSVHEEDDDTRVKRVWVKEWWLEKKGLI